MNLSELHWLAERAGLLVHWHDYLGRPKRVEPAILKRVLATLELPAETPGQVRASLARLDEEAQRQATSMLIVSVGETVCLPPVMSTAATLELQLESGEHRTVPVFHTEAGAAIEGIGECGYHWLEGAGESLQLAVAPIRAFGLADLVGERRIWGLAAQAYSLRRAGDGGVGDFTALAQAARACAAQGADLLTVSPLHALFAGDATRYGPYAPSSRLFVNAMHVDPAAVLGKSAVRAQLKALGLTQRWAQLEALPLIDWPEVNRLRQQLLRALWDDHAERLQSGHGQLAESFRSFRLQGGAALESHARFEVLHSHRYADDATQWHWRSWPAALQDPASAAVQRFAEEHAHEVGFHVFLQWLADQGHAAAQAAARDAGMAVGLVSDLAVGTDSGGSQAWSHQRDLLVGLSVGAPPDLLNSLGQNWGLTSFSPRALRQNAYAPFLAMLRAVLRNAGGVRIDHVLGLGRLWLIPEGEEGGCYLRYPLADFYKLIALESWRHRAVILGEDLGTVPDDFRGPLADAGILGMRVLWFEHDQDMYIEPPRWSPQAMAMTTTHDLPTVAGWWRGHDIAWRSRLGQRGPDRTEEGEVAERKEDRTKIWNAFVRAGVAEGEPPAVDNPQPAVDAAVSFVAATCCPLSTVPLEDIMGLEEQPNFPGTTHTHPNWQQRFEQPMETLLDDPAASRRLASLRDARP